MTRASEKPKRPPRGKDPVLDYAKKVLAGKIVAGPYVRKACERHLLDLKRKDLVWRLDKAVRAIAFFKEMLVLENGEPFVLEPWQAFVIGSCFGWYGPAGFRRFRTAYVESSKGSGKTPMAAGVGLLGLVADGEKAPEVYAAAVMRDQAKICFKDAVRMVEASPELAALVQVQVGSLTINDDHAVFRPVSSEHKGLDGLRVHIGLIDELHEHPTATVVDKVRAGTKSRRNALIFEITNSGWDRTSVCWAHHELSVKVLEGTVENDAWFCFVCGLDPEDSWQDERVWLKANPSLGTVLPIEYLREQVRDAAGMPSKENIVKRLNFCIWTEQSERWLDLEAWDRAAEPIDADALRGESCMMALDAASTNDLAATVKLFGPDDEGRFRVLPRFWIPEASLDAKGSGRTEADRLMLRKWVDAGLITATPGNVIDYDFIEAEILQDVQDYQVKKLAFDRWNVTQLVTHLKNAMGEDRVVDFPQNFQGMSAPSKELEKVVASGKLLHGGHPVLRWMASNVAAKEGPNEQMKPDRERSRDKIDGIVCIVMDLGMWMREPQDGPEETDYSVEWVG